MYVCIYIVIKEKTNTIFKVKIYIYIYGKLFGWMKIWIVKKLRFELCIVLLYYGNKTGHTGILHDICRDLLNLLRMEHTKC